MKKILSLILAALMCLSLCTPALADDGDMVARLILDMKEKFEISDEDFVFEDYSKDEYDGHVTYYLSWRSKAETEYTYQPYISVRVQADGDVEYYRLSQSFSSQLALPKFTENEAIRKAAEYISVIAPDRTGSLADGKLAETSQYSVQFERLENGIPVAGDYISVELHPEDLSLIRYNANWTETDFPEPDGIITMEQAEEAYKTNIGYELLYNIKTEKGEIKDIYLSYEAKDSSAFIDAFSGDAAKHTGLMYKTSGSAMNDAAEATAESRALSPEEQKMVDDIKNMITKEDAEAIARGVAEFAIREDAEVTNYSVSANNYGDYVAYVYFSKNTRDDYYNARVSINAKTEEIMAFSKSANTKDTKKTYDAGKAKKDAEAFLNKYYADKMAEVKPEFIIGETDKYRFSYDRYTNGIKVKNNGINICINEYTGEIDNFSYTWADTEFPSAEDAVALNAIYKNLFALNNFRLQYMIATEYTYEKETGKETKTVSTNLVYVHQETPIYSAETGFEIDSRGMAITEKFAGYRDLNGHYSEYAATELAKIGIYFEGGRLNPDAAITQEEFLKFMSRAVYGYYYDSDIYRQLISEGVLTEEDIADNITRIDGIKYFINAMGFKKAAQIQGIYNCPFADVAYDMQGYAALAGGLGIVNHGVNTLRAGDLMTRGECVTMIYNYLKN